MMTTGQLHLGDLFRSRRERGKAGLPVLSVTMSDGLVPRHTLERKTNGNLAPEEHLLIRKDDIAYNMMRMWQGASGLAEKDGIVSPAHVVVAPKDEIDPLFASYWFKSARMIYLFWAYSYGITGDRLRLYYKDFAKIPITVPPKSEQESIGCILDRTDRAIEQIQKLIAARRKLKKGLAQQLLTGYRRLPGYTKPWKKLPLSQMGKCIRGVSYKAPDDLSPTDTDNTVRLLRAGNIAEGQVIHTDLQFVTSNRVQVAQILREHDVAICMSSGSKGLVGKAARYRPLNERRYTMGAFCSIFRPNMDADAALVPQLFVTEAYRRWIYVLTAGSSINNLTAKDIEEFAMPLPTDKYEQHRIADALGAADRGVALLEKKLAALRELKRGLMQKLLTVDASGAQVNDG